MGKRGNVLAIMSAKGGTGKTSTTANLAFSLSEYFNKKVLAVDTNITTASLGLHFGVDCPKVTIYDVLKKNYPVEIAIVNYSKNLDIVPACLRCLDKNENEKDLFSVAKKVRKLVDNYDNFFNELTRKYDMVLLDSASGFSFEALANFKIADEILFVTNPDYPSVVATAKAVSYAKFLDVPIWGIILNKVTKKSYELKQKEIEELTGSKIAAEIPLDNSVLKSVSKGVPITLYNKYSPASIAFRELSGLLIKQKYERNVLESLTMILNRV